jgi:predicted porin
VQIKKGAEKTTESQIGIDVPVTAALTLSVGYAVSEDNAAIADGADRSGFGVAAGYKIGESTTVYGGARQAKEKVGSVKDSLIAVGINHAF